MNTTKHFTNFEYIVRSDFILENKREVIILFSYQDIYRIKLSLFINKEKGRNDDYYINEAKKIINQKIKDGSLEKYSEKCAKEQKKKKLLLIFIPLFTTMAIAGITVGCYYGLRVTSNEVKVIDPEINGLVIEKQTAIIGQDFDTKISINTDLVDNYILPETLSEVKSGDNVLDASCYTYKVNNDYLSASLHIPAEYTKGDISIKLTLDEMPWYLDKKYINGLTEADVIKEGGEIQTIKVNGLDHKVRLIGVDEDCMDITKPEETKIHTTWEFVNLISDKEGYSLVTQWNDTDDGNTANYNYLNSSIRKALTGNGSGHILWAQKDGTAWSTNPLYKDKCVLDMLPSKFVSVLKAPSKYINIYDDFDLTYKELTVEDKLFLLSPKEINTNGGEPSATTYTYYNGAANPDRIKKQVNNEETCTTTQQISYVAESGQLYTNNVTSYAGYNGNAGTTGNGGVSWLRSPYTFDSSKAWRCSYNGGVTSNNLVYTGACSIAPAFCI